MEKKKLIEVALPLEKINAASAREKSIRHGHPSTLHLWWARRPLASARAVIWASLVDDPSSRPEEFPTLEMQDKERQRLFRILEDLVAWENSNNKDVLDTAKREIMKSTNNNPPALLDPFAGGGAIPLEAQRLGLEAHAHDLNPVAVMINKAMIEIPPRFAGQAPVNPEARSKLASKTEWKGATGLAEDVRYYGELLKEEAFKRIGHLYPKVRIPEEQGGGEANVIAWIWARTVKCPNPACGCEMPIARSFTLSKKKGQEAYIEPIIDNENNQITYSIRIGGEKPQNEPKLSRGANFKCIVCGEATSSKYLKEESVSGRIGAQLIGIVAEGERGRVYISPNEEHELVAKIEKPEEYPTGRLTNDRLSAWAQTYGLDTFDKLFTNRQLKMQTTLSGLVRELKPLIEKESIDSGMTDDHISLEKGGAGAQAYSEAVTTYLTFVLDKMTDYHSSICSWNSSRENIRNVFGRQVIPMSWDYAEGNPFSESSGSFNNMLAWVIKSIEQFPASKTGYAEQFEAQSDYGLRDVMISTDPPYYDNIGYADLSDYFYVWMRDSLKETYPDLFKTLLVPKEEELIATPYRHGGSRVNAKRFFEQEMVKACKQIYKSANPDIPVTIYYAYKQNDSNPDDLGRVSSGWETMLTALIQSGFSVTGTWPMRTERPGRSIGIRANALSSSIVLVCRKRAQDAPVQTRRNFINELRRELRSALQKLQSSNIAPVDLAQSAIGPGMAVFSKYSQILESDGTPMTVRDALKIINQELDLFLNEQSSDLDSESQFCTDLYAQYAFNDMPYGDANTLANAKNSSIGDMTSHGVLYAQKGKVHLVERSELPAEIDKNERNIWLVCQQLTYLMEKEGIEGCAKAIVNMLDSTAEKAKDLAYRLFTIAESKHWPQEAYAYNSLVVGWPDIQNRVTELRLVRPEQISMFD